MSAALTIEQKAVSATNCAVNSNARVRSRPERPEAFQCVLNSTPFLYPPTKPFATPSQALEAAPSSHQHLQPRPATFESPQRGIHQSNTAHSAPRLRGQSDRTLEGRTRGLTPLFSSSRLEKTGIDRARALAQPREVHELADDQTMEQSTPRRTRRATSSSERRPSTASASPRRERTDTDTYIELSRVRRREILARVNESVQTVMASMLSDKSKRVQWKPKLRKKDISYFTDDVTVKPGQTRFCCVTHTHVPVADVMKLFVASEDVTMQRNIRVLSDSLLEARVLSVLRRPTKERPMKSVYIRYACYQTPGLMMNRKVCVAVATDMIHQPDGSVIGYCLWDSIDDPEFAEASNTSSLQSCTMFRSGFFLRRSGRLSSSKSDIISTKIVYMIGLEPGGWAPGFTARLLMEKFGGNLTRLCSHFRRKHLDSRTFVMKADWESKLAAKSCHECQKLFQVLSTRVNCHACGHVVCRACALKEQVELHAVGLVSMHICVSCLAKAGLPVPVLLTKQSTLRRRRLHSDTAAGSTQGHVQPRPLYHSQSAVERAFIEDEAEDDDEEDDTDTGEWAFTASGMPFRPNRIKRGDNV